MKSYLTRMGRKNYTSLLFDVEQVRGTRKAMKRKTRQYWRRAACKAQAEGNYENAKRWRSRAKGWK